MQSDAYPERERKKETSHESLLSSYYPHSLVIFDPKTTGGPADHNCGNDSNSIYLYMSFMGS